MNDAVGQKLLKVVMSAEFELAAHLGLGLQG